MIPNNTYKSLRLLGEGYNLYYSVWCSNEHELYDLSVSPVSCFVFIVLTLVLRPTLINYIISIHMALKRMMESPEFSVAVCPRP